MNTSDDESLIRKSSNVLFSIFYVLNASLINVSENEYEYDLNKVFDLYIYSNCISYFKNIYLGLIESKGLLFNARCIIEGIALKKLVNSNEVDDISIKLFEKQHMIIEYRNYRDLLDKNPKIFDAKKFENDYCLTVTFFENLLKEMYSKKEIEKIINSKIPFLHNSKLTYSKIIESQLGKEALDIYSLLSHYIHPNCNMETEKHFIKTFFNFIYLKLIETYGNFESYPFLFKNYYNMIFQSNTAKNYKTSINKICDSITDVGNSLAKTMGYNYLSNSFKNIALLLKDVFYDKIIGINEQAKSKFKVLIEMVSNLFYELRSDKPSIRLQLLINHELCNFDKLNITKYLTESYKLYKQIYPNGISMTDFSIKFQKTTGFTIDESGNLISLTKIFKNCVSILNNSDGFNMYDTALLYYSESQMLSHANGYMWFANKGAFDGASNIFNITISLLISMLTLLKEALKILHKETNDYIFRKCSNVCKCTVKTLNEELKKIDDYEKSPKIDLLDSKEFESLLH